MEHELFKYKDQHDRIINYPPEQVLNTPGAKQRQKNQKFVCCFCFKQTRIYTGYEDGMILSWDQ